MFLALWTNADFCHLGRLHFALKTGHTRISWRRCCEESDKKIFRFTLDYGVMYFHFCFATCSCVWVLINSAQQFHVRDISKTDSFSAAIQLDLHSPPHKNCRMTRESKPVSEAALQICLHRHASHITVIPLDTEHCDRVSSNPSSYLTGPGFRSRPGERFSCPRFSCFSSVPLGKFQDSHLKLDLCIRSGSCTATFNNLLCLPLPLPSASFPVHYS
jgi:hypothetical protein